MRMGERKRAVLTQATVIAFIRLPFWARVRWFLFGWQSLKPERNRTMRQAFRAEKQRTTGDSAA